jgi:ethanolamine utilization cobalamin adenosyltransferase
MSIVTESELRELWQNGRGLIPAFPPGTRFSPAAQDFLAAHPSDVQLSEQLKTPSGGQDGPDWDKPSVFPVILSGPVPVCAECGQPLPHKPDHMTQIDAGHFASKASPRLALCGRVDGLQAQVMLTAAVARRFMLPELGRSLDSLAAYCRELLSAEYAFRPAAPLTLLGKTENELQEMSHWPDKYLGFQHLTPGPQDHEMLHWLNLLRTQAREVELAALQAFPADGLDPAGVGVSLRRGLNRLSSAVYVLELYFQSGKITWKAVE